MPVLFGKRGFGAWFYPGKEDLGAGAAPGSSFPSLDPASGSPILSFLQEIWDKLPTINAFSKKT